MQDQLGFIGLGNMGGPMCANLLAAGYPVMVFDLADDAVQRQVDEGAIAANSAREVAATADILLTSLPRPDHVIAVMQDGGALEALTPGSLWVDMTTNRVDLIVELAAAAPAEVDVVDAPVTGAVDGARNAALTLFIGGRSAPVERAVPLLSHLGRVIECGPLGSGNVTKLVTNQLWFIHAAAIGEAFALGMANGVSLAVLWDAIRDSVANSFVAEHDAPSIFAGHYDPSFSLDLCLKDLGLIDQLSTGVGTDLTMTAAANAAFRDAAELYGTDVGELHVARRIEDRTGLTFRLDGDWTPHWEK